MPNLETMKIAKQIYVDNRVRTLIECTHCGCTTHIKAGTHTKTSQAAIERPCKACNPAQNPLNNKGWWHDFGLDKNPGVYGPMPRLRTSLRYRLEEARRMGWMAWSWEDEYKEERKGVVAR